MDEYWVCDDRVAACLVPQCERAVKRRKESRVVELTGSVLRADQLPGFLVDDRRAEFGLPDDVSLLPLGIVLEAGEREERAVGGQKGEEPSMGRRCLRHSAVGASVDGGHYPGLSHGYRGVAIG